MTNMAECGDCAAPGTRGNEAPKRLVLKIGSSTLTTSASSLDYGYLDMLAAQLAELRADGWQIAIVSSGAIACGLGRIGMSERPTDIPTLQAAASVGQSELAGAYADALGAYDMTTSLVLLTRRDTADRRSYLHARDTFERLLELGVVPIVNENDTVSVEQICFGDNDTLAALVACLVDASLLVIASDIDGLYDANPRECPEAKLIGHVEKIDRSVISVAGGAGTAAGSGGMQTKVRAARVMMAAGIPLAIVNGKLARAVVDTARGMCPGTVFRASEKPHAITPKKLWIALGDSSRGAIVVDAGARRALVERGSSILAVGVREVRGSFEDGDIIDVEDVEGVIVARGKVSACSDEIELACGKTSDQLAENRLIADLATKPIIHRDDLIVFE